MWYDRFSVEKRKVLMTGTTGAIGMALVQGFLEAGATVFAVTRRENADWGGLAEQYADALIPLYADLNKLEEVRALAANPSVLSVDVLINAAALCPHDTSNLYSLESLRSTTAVTLESAYLLCGQIAPVMAARGKGSIINVTSINAERAWPGSPSYIVAKSGLRMLTRAIARDFGEQGVRANNLSPGYVHSRMTQASFADPAMHEERRAHTMLGRWGTPEDMVGPCLFLASDASSYITGADLHVEGGWLAKGM